MIIVYEAGTGKVWGIGEGLAAARLDAQRSLDYCRKRGDDDLPADTPAFRAAPATAALVALIERNGGGDPDVAHGWSISASTGIADVTTSWPTVAE